MRWVVTALLWLLALPLFAHEARPLVVSIDEMQPGQYRSDLRVPPTVTPDNQPRLRWPKGCVPEQLQVRCGESIAGQELEIIWPLFNPAITTLLRFTPQGAATRTVVLGPQERQWQLPEKPSGWQVARQYLVLGVEHILLGIDHLLFVLGLLLIAREPRRILFAITGFTVAHSITLSAAALGVLHVPVPPTEAAIALSIVFLAREVLAQSRDSIAWRYPVVVSFVFGLLHGLGFASALSGIGLPDGEVAVALLFFNIGVEVGQLAFIFAVLAAISLLLRVLRFQGAAGSGQRESVSQVMAWGIGISGCFWLLQRVLAMHS